MDLFQLGDTWQGAVIRVDAPKDGGGCHLCIMIAGEKHYWWKLTVDESLRLQSALNSHTRSGEVW